MTVPFARAWWSFELGKLRPCEDDYGAFPIDSLPPLNEKLFKGTFQWLVDDDDDDDDDDDLDDDEDDDDIATAGPGTPVVTPAKQLAALNAALAAVGAALPAPFVRFMGDAELQDAVPTCMGCEWDLSARPIESPFEDDAWIVRFLRDPEGALSWYLHITPGGTYVICSPVAFDDPALDEPPAALQERTWWCAPHFEHFLYRFWIENVLWELLEDNAMLTPAEAAYAAHYKPGKRPAAKKPTPR
jgi:hypothetical protein